MSDITTEMGRALSRSLASPAAGETSSISDHLNGEFDVIIELSNTRSSLCECVSLSTRNKERTIELVLITESDDAFNRAAAVMTKFAWPNTTRVNIFKYDHDEPEGLNYLCQSVWWHLYSAQKGREFSHQLYFDDGCETEFDRSAPPVLAAWAEISRTLHT